ncbi:MAG: DUF4190 domain-containing protein [Cryobacterium sp.]|nr:DUF4190 domain-containing protein [Cryobacterium sp.]
MISNLTALVPVLFFLLLFALSGLIVPLRAHGQKIRDGEIVLSEKMNTLAIAAFVLAFFVSIAAVVLGHIALSQIRRTNEQGWGLAYAGVFLGYLGLAAGCVAIFILTRGG